MKQLKKYSEAIIWTGALIALFFMDVNHSSLCMFRAMGITWCPGCGLGHAMHYALHLNFVKSFNEHFLGVPAVIILMYQIFKSTIKIKNNSYGSAKNYYDVS